ncbi:paxillin-like isoform X2 [Lytechinus variegatus]|uniref:paxillin-like isoform X2 n=1 Tax=Lytechinus variegatus TaxID=7654 RepID=UPI001BB15178|nr:paxillin-like isoform X2 [Lytechinus variegatus]
MLAYLLEDALLADLDNTRAQLKENRERNIQDSPYSYPVGALSPHTPVSPIYSEIANGFSPSPSPASHPTKNSYRIQQAESEPLYQVQDIQLPPTALVYSEPPRGNSYSQQSPTYSLEYTPRTPTSPPLSDHQEGSVAPPKPARSRPNGRQPPPTLPKPTLPKPTVFRYDKAATASYQNSTYQPTPAPPRMAGMPVSELDSLLQELEAAQSQIQNCKYDLGNEYASTPPPKPPPPAAGIVKPPRTNMGGGVGGGGGGGVSDLNDMLDDLVGTVTPSSYTVETTTKTYTTHSQPPARPQPAPPTNGAPPPQQQQQPINRVMANNTHAPPPGGQSQISMPPPRTASSATKELDDLMASLSDFQLSPTDTMPQEPAYAQPHKVTPPPKPAHPPPNMVNINNTPPPPVAQSYPPQQPPAPAQQNHAPSQPSQLDSMLDHLNSDVSRQGVQTITKGMCAACQKPIAGQIVTALGQTWHSEHFVCAGCQKGLGTQTFFERDAQAFCEECYHDFFAPKCAYCNGPIKDRCVTAMDKTWHPDHFFCAQCGKTFGDSGFHEKNGRAYCRDDYFDMFAPKCGGCNRAIMDNFITALNAQWHPDCFVCATCRKPFNEGDFFDHDGVPYCEIHYHAVRGSLCAGCNKPITSRCITAMQRKFHPECFVCDYCLKQLNKGTFKEQNGKAYCHTCFIKLFN